MSKQFPELHILPVENFFNPSWSNVNAVLFDSNINEYQFDIINKYSYCIHLWESFSVDYLKILDEKNIHSISTIYNILARKFT